MLPNFKGDDVSQNDKTGSGYDKRGWAARTGYLGPEVSKRIVSDPRLELLSMEALGVFMMLHARFAQDMPTSSVSKHACRVFGVQAKAWKSIVAELSEAQPPLVTTVDGNLVPEAIGHTVAPELSKKRSAAGKKAWAAPRTQRSATLTLLPGASAVAEGTTTTAPVAHPVAPVRQEAQAAAPLNAESISAPAVDPVASVTTPVEPGSSAPGQVGPSAVAPASEQKGFQTPPQPKRKPTKKQLAAASAEAGQPQQLGLLGIDAPPPDPNVVPYGHIVSLFHKHCPDLNTVISIDKWTTKRKGEVAKRHRENPELDWESFFKSIHADDFLCGRTISDRNWKANFDWIMNANHFMRILEGNYGGSSRGTSLFNQGGAKTAADYKDTVVDENDEFMRVAREREEQERAKKQNNGDTPGGVQ